MHQSKENSTAAKKNPAVDDDLRYANVDEKKRKRMISNRNSARRCRIKRLQHLDELADQLHALKAENAEAKRKIIATSEMRAAIESENIVLRAQLTELTDRLRSLNLVLCIIDEVSDVDIEIPEIPDTSAEPWRLPCPGTSIATFSDVFRP